MISPIGMETFEARLESFNVVHQGTKKRTSNAKSATKLKWSHKSPDPAQVNASCSFLVQPRALTERSLQKQAYSTIQKPPRRTTPHAIYVTKIWMAGRRMIMRLKNMQIYRQAVAGQQLRVSRRTSKMALASKETL